MNRNTVSEIMSIEWIEADKYSRADRTPQISIYSRGEGRLSQAMVDRLEIDAGDHLRFCAASMNDDEEKSLYMTIMEEGPGIKVKEYGGDYKISATGLVYALGRDHREEKLRIIVDDDPIFKDEMFFYPCKITERD